MIEDYKTDVQLKGLLSRLTVLYKNDKNDYQLIFSWQIILLKFHRMRTRMWKLSAHATDLEGTPADLVVDDYVAFSDKDSCSWLPGTIVEVSKTHCKIKKMKRSTGSSFVWPENKTPVTVECKDILNFLEPPTFSHRYWSFSKEGTQQSDDAFSLWRTNSQWNAGSWRNRDSFVVTVYNLCSVSQKFVCEFDAG